jgi:alanine dehydrogenase
MMIGIRREDKNLFERRVPLTPGDVKHLVDNHGLRIQIQSSTRPPVRIFSDEEYIQAGAEIMEDLSGCDLILGVKEVPPELFIPGKAYIMFSHTVKCQPYNMTMLQYVLDRKCTLFDYELITDDHSRRLVFFGRYAGLAGMIDSLCAYGKRLEAEGRKNLFSGVKMAHEYDSLLEAKADLMEVGGKINAVGFSDELTPLVCGFTGYGNVSLGAQEILDLFPLRTISPAELLTLSSSDSLSRHHIYKVVFTEADMVTRRSDEPFDLQHYYHHPDEYDSHFADYLPSLSLLINGIYWTEKYPRLITDAQMAELYSGGQASLRVIGDISADIEGSIECLKKVTVSDNPCYVYEPASSRVIDGYTGNGPVMMAVDNLPCEVPREASEFFSQALKGYIAELADRRLTNSADVELLPKALRKAMITFQGQLTPEFEYIADSLPRRTTSE